MIPLQGFPRVSWIPRYQQYYTSHRDCNYYHDYVNKKIMSSTSEPSVGSAMVTKLDKILQQSESEGDVSVDKSQLNCLIGMKRTPLHVLKDKFKIFVV